MTKIYDLKKTDLALKASEGIVAFAGFFIPLKSESSGEEGVMKISAFYKQDDSGYFLLTLIVDTKGGTQNKTELRALFDDLSEQKLSPYLGKDFSMLLKIPLDVMEDLDQLYIQELYLFFQKLKGREKPLLEKTIIPALERILPCSFEKVEWWDGEKMDSSIMHESNISTIDGLKKIFKRFLKPGSMF